jgi:hypothetical protein
MNRVPANRYRLRRCSLLVIVLALFLCFPLPRLRAADYEEHQGPATLRLEGAQVDKGRVEARLSDEFRLLLEVEGPTGMEVQPVPSPGPDWQTVSRSPPETVALPQGRVRWQQTLRLRPTRPGQVPLAMPDLRYRENDGEAWKEVRWTPIQTQVSTAILKPDISELRGITGPEPVPPAPSWWSILGWIAGSLTGLALFLAGWSVWRRRGSVARSLTPDQWALQEIDRISAWPRGNDAEVERFYTAICDVIRRYLELRFQLPALEQTTSEFFASLRSSSQLPAGHHELLRRFLERCDLVKFARAASSPEECQEMVATARQIIS